MKKIAKVLLIVCITLASAAHAQKQPSVQQLTKTLREAVNDALLDAPSARFKDEFISGSENENSNALSLCGLVNSKNSFGGYVGFKPFISNTEGMVILDTAEVPSATQYLWPVWCSHPVKSPGKAK